MGDAQVTLQDGAEWTLGTWCSGKGSRGGVSGRNATGGHSQDHSAGTMGLLRAMLSLLSPLSKQAMEVTTPSGCLQVPHLPTLPQASPLPERAQTSPGALSLDCRQRAFTGTTLGPDTPKTTCHFCLPGLSTETHWLWHSPRSGCVRGHFSCFSGVPGEGRGMLALDITAF